MNMQISIIRAVAGFFCFVSILSGQTVEIINNHEFPIAMPWQLRDGRVVLVDVAAKGSQRIEAAAPASQTKLEGKLEWDVVVEEIDKTPTDAEAGGNARDFAGQFSPIEMTGDDNALEGSKHGLKLRVEFDRLPGGWIDIRTKVTNESAPRAKVYAAVVMRWTAPGVASRSVNYDNRVTALTDGGTTPFRKGEGRHLFIQRGVDWINTGFADRGVLIMHDFAPSFTVHRKATTKTPARWIGANTAQIAQEAMVKGDSLYNITEIARPNIQMYRSRLADNVLPGPDESIEYKLRVFVGDKVSNERADQLFIAYTGYNEETKASDTTRVSFGVPYVKFGTAYFPFSTLGENFEKWHLPGQTKESYWPLSGDTVTQYKLFADDIRRDLRIAKAMGFETIRLHHLEEIARLDKRVQDEYLDFLFAELKHVGLTALLDVKLPPPRVAELVQKYLPQVDGVEIDNEVLIFGIDDADVPRWKETYAAVKAVAPDLPVWLTGHTNTGAFERLRELGVPFDKVGAHAYMDSLDAITSARDYALAVANYGSEIGKPPIITEWNWRFLTRMTPEARAKVYPPIFENVLKTRCMPVLYQFQFQESLAMAPRTLRGIRHYEQLNLSRRPRPEAMEFVKLIDNYGNPSSPQQTLHTEYQSVTMQPAMNGRATIKVSVANRSDKPRTLIATAEGPSDLRLSITGRSKFEVQPNQTATAMLDVVVPPDALPGFYHCFVRFDAGDGLVSYGWVELRNPNPPSLDKDKGMHPEVVYRDGALDFDLNRDIAIVYGTDCPGWEVESAWLIYQTLESATGRPVKIFQLNDLPNELRDQGNLIVVGTSKSNALVKEPSDKPTVSTAGDTLIVSGKDEEQVNLATIDLVLRYWLHAKDSASRRVGITDQPIQTGPDPSFLP